MYGTSGLREERLHSERLREINNEIYTYQYCMYHEKPCDHRLRA